MSRGISRGDVFSIAIREGRDMATSRPQDPMAMDHILASFVSGGLGAALALSVAAGRYKTALAFLVVDVAVSIMSGR